MPRIRSALARVKNTQAAQQAAYLGGVLVLLTGGSGALVMVRVGRRLLETVSPRLAGFLHPFFLAVALVAAAGGLSVIVGGYFLTRRRLLGKVLITLGSGVGLLGFAAQIVAVTIAGRDPAMVVLRLALTVQGVGVLCVLYAQARG